MTHIEALKLAATAISNALNSDMAQREEDEGEVSATLNELRQALTAISTALKSGEPSGDIDYGKHYLKGLTKQQFDVAISAIATMGDGMCTQSLSQPEGRGLAARGAEVSPEGELPASPTSEPVKVDEPTEEMCDAARWFILARDSNIHTWGGLSRCIDTTIPYIAEKMRNDPQGHITKWDFADCVYRLMQSVATPNQGKVSVEERCSPYNRQKWAETIARYFAGYSFSKHESRQCLGLVDVLIANGVSFPTPPAQAEE